MKITVSYSVLVTGIFLNSAFFGPPLTRGFLSSAGAFLLSAYLCEAVYHVLYYKFKQKHMNNDSNKSDTVLPLKKKIFIWGCTAIAFLLGLFGGSYLGVHLIYDVFIAR